jgi:predicted nucleotidyltransferase
MCYKMKTMTLIDTLRLQKDTINALAARYGARRIRVFGSVARGEERPDSDVDFLVDYPPGYDLFLQRMPLAEALEGVTGRRIDLLPEHELNKHFRAYIMEEAVEL